MHPLVKAMTRLGVFKVTMISTVFSALASTFVTWIFSFFIAMQEPALHFRLAFLVPFFVAPGFSYFTALAMRESRRARVNAVKAARIDPLTELLNRRAFFEADGRALEKFGPLARRTILFVDIDHFKSINDSHGHEGGDEVLRHFSKLILKCLRKDDLVARFGGEEFVVELTGASPEEVENVAERIRSEAQSTPAAFRSGFIDFTVSIGVSGGSFAELIDRLLSSADAQLYLAKQSGRNCVRGQDRNTPAPIPFAAAREMSSAACNPA